MKFFAGLFWLLCAITAFSAPLPLKWQQGNNNEVYYLRQSTEFKEISESELIFFRSTIERANRENAKAVILELDTPGGNVETAFKYVSVMEKSQVPIIVYLNPNGISAGMILALAADRIAISPNGLIGDAMPMQEDPLGNVKPLAERQKENAPTGQTPQQIQPLLNELKKLPNSNNTAEEQRLVNQKFLSVYFKLLQVLAEKNQRPVKVIRAMADPYTVLTMQDDKFDYKSASPLTLSADEALKLGVVDHIVSSRNDLLQQLGLQDAQLCEVKKSGWEEIGDFLAHPFVTVLLLIFGLVGLFIEIKTPGFGVPGMLGVTALTLFFLGHVATGESGWGPIVIFFVGILLLALEIFIVPGFGLVGIMGLLCILISFFGAFGLDNIHYAARVITISLILSIALMVLLAVYVLPKTSVFSKVSLKTEMKSDEGYQAQQADPALIGSCGIAVTDLRPSGSIKIGNERHDAASEGDYLEAGCEVEVCARNGFQLIVRRKNS